MGMVRGQPWRSYLSLTLFLTEPDSYEVGELVLNTDLRLESFKLPMGHIVLYSTLVLHRVNPVTKGERRAMVCWAQSTVRGPKQRQALWDVAKATGFLQNNIPEGTEHMEAVKLMKIYSNLACMWSEMQSYLGLPT